MSSSTTSTTSSSSSSSSSSSLISTSSSASSTSITSSSSTSSSSPTSSSTSTSSTTSISSTTSPTTTTPSPTPPRSSDVTQPTTTTRMTSSVLTAPLTSVIQTTVVTTRSGGLLSTYVVSSTSVFSAGSTITAAALPSQSSSRTNTAAIAGGVIGGIALLSVLALFFVWYRSKHRFDDEFDGNFNPDRILTSTAPNSKLSDGATLPNVEFGGADTTVTPFPAGFTRPAPAPAPAPAMYQHNQHNPSPSISSNPSTYSPYPSGVTPYTDYATSTDSKHRYSAQGSIGPSHQYQQQQQQQQPNDWRTVSPGPTLSTQSSYTTNSTAPPLTTPLIAPRNAKEREALSRYAAPGTMHLATQFEEPAGPYFPQPQQQQQQGYFRPPPGAAMAMTAEPTLAGPSSHPSVLVHQDGGRVPTKADEAARDAVPEPPEEIPPTYDSIRS